MINRRCSPCDCRSCSACATRRRSPTVARVLLHILGPNYRPVQVTQDLASFWRTTYAQVRKELRARYPKHAWPDDPLSAAPQRGARRRTP
ncbi:MAG: ATP-dependent helicase C-terminal domain-containing protein [Planctomycetota bacterium]